MDKSINKSKKFEVALHDFAKSRNFDLYNYLQLYPDVAATKVDPLCHYMRYGKVEGRKMPYKRMDGFISRRRVAEPLVSIVMPVYNGEVYLKEALLSLFAQEFTNFEIIVVDDGSTDGSSRILDLLSQEDKRLLVIPQSNRGAGAARNLGLRFAQAAYVMFLDADDLFMPNMLSEMYDRISRESADVCVCGSNSLAMDTGKVFENRHAIRVCQLPNLQHFSMRDVEGNVFDALMGWAWDKLYSKDFLLRNSVYFQEIATTNDMYFTYKSLLRASIITTCITPLITHRLNVPDSVSANRDKSPLNFYYALRAVRQELLELEIYERFSQSFVNYAMISFLWNFDTISEKGKREMITLLPKFVDDFDLLEYNEDFAINREAFTRFRTLYKKSTF